MGTYSDGGRVRYIGIFQDPNELACATSISLPFVFMWFGEDRGRGRGRRLLAPHRASAGADWRRCSATS